MRSLTKCLEFGFHALLPILKGACYMTTHGTADNTEDMTEAIAISCSYSCKDN